MQPYLRYLKADIREIGTEEAKNTLAELPLGRRYVWRVASAVKWAFAGLELSNVEADKQTMSVEDTAKLVELLPLRPAQFCIFMKAALIDNENMEAMMLGANKATKRVE